LLQEHSCKSGLSDDFDHKSSEVAQFFLMSIFFCVKPKVSTDINITYDYFCSILASMQQHVYVQQLPFTLTGLKFSCKSMQVFLCLITHLYSDTAYFGWTSTGLH